MVIIMVIVSSVITPKHYVKIKRNKFREHKFF